mmetsp:Transcript_26646/g.41358  ORF Transcript_26646/g.41358 Transcript_26646/m.41358 type:complete len:85 (-) Transcript_26646:706-960(-)
MHRIVSIIAIPHLHQPPIQNIIMLNRSVVKLHCRTELSSRNWFFFTSSSVVCDLFEASMEITRTVMPKIILLFLPYDETSRASP